MNVKPTPNPTAALRVRRLVKEYESTNPPTKVLNGIDLDVASGEFLAVMGASGSGKSTLLYCAGDMDRPSSGQVFLGDKNLMELSQRQLSRVRLTMMGFIFQQGYFLNNLNIRDNILLPALKAGKASSDEIKGEVQAFMDRFNITKIADHGITQVSGGELQRASICRALGTNPDIIFADEPTGALNIRMGGEVMEVLVDIHRAGKTIMMVTHDPSCAAHADRVVYLRDGTIIDECRFVATAILADRETLLLAWLADHDF